MDTTKLMLLFNVGGFRVTMALTILLLKGQHHVNTIGWICAAFSLAVFAAPFSIIVVLHRRVIKTKSVEFMPITPSFHTLCPSTWFFCGLFVKDVLFAVSAIWLPPSFNSNGFHCLCNFVAVSGTRPDSHRPDLNLQTHTDAPVSHAPPI
ncbi:hypothetical protein NL676_020108 [Syzygium grande]|nr:hypothetical protein NL676_020108 [Syzygium grande]